MAIDYHATATSAVRDLVSARLDDRKEALTSIPLDQVPTTRGEIVALRWLLAQLSPPPQEITE